jgi:hypothetical protein
MMSFPTCTRSAETSVWRAGRWHRWLRRGSPRPGRGRPYARTGRTGRRPAARAGQVLPPPEHDAPAESGCRTRKRQQGLASGVEPISERFPARTAFVALLSRPRLAPTGCRYPLSRAHPAGNDAGCNHAPASRETKVDRFEDRGTTMLRSPRALSLHGPSSGTRVTQSRGKQRRRPKPLAIHQALTWL